MAIKSVVACVALAVLLASCVDALLSEPNARPFEMKSGANAVRPHGLPGIPLNASFEHVMGIESGSVLNADRPSVVAAEWMRLRQTAERADE